MIMMMYVCGVVWFRRRLRRYGYFLNDVLLGGQCYRGFGVDSERRGGFWMRLPMIDQVGRYTDHD